MGYLNLGRVWIVEHRCHMLAYNVCLISTDRNSRADGHFQWERLPFTSSAATVMTTKVHYVY